MQRLSAFLLLLFSLATFAQQSDFGHVDFSKADNIAKSVKVKRLYKLNDLTFKLTKDLDTEVEKFRAIYFWICNNIANDFGLYSKNERKRNKFEKDSLKLQDWNSKFKKKLFKKLLKNKRTICSGYAYMLKEMCSFIGIESKMVNGFGRTSTVDFSQMTMPNHTWSIVKLNDKWYLCDPTWSTGISFPEEGRFRFNYNNGYFLTEPKLFFKNHYPIESQYALLGKTPSFKEFTEMPLLYADAFKYLKEHKLPSKMENRVQKDSLITFQFKVKDKIDLNKIKFAVYSGKNERRVKPLSIDLNKDVITLQHKFKRRGFYDFHLYIENKIIATYTYEVVK